jgi:tetratricopeptide (TPR) repeat protein
MDENYEGHVEAVQCLKQAEELYSSMSYDELYGPIMECLELDPDLGRAWELNGMVMFYYGDMEGARSAFMEATSKRGHYPEAKWALTLMEGDKWPMGDGPEADIARYNMLGNQLLNDRKWQGAALCYTKISEMTEPDWRIKSIMGLIYREMGLLEPSLEIYEEAASMPGAPPEVLFDTSVVLIKLGRFQEAESMLLDLIDEVGPSPPLLNNLGTAVEAQDREDEAMEIYEEAVEMDPKYYPSLYSKGRLLQKQGKMEEAREVLGQALDREGRVFDIDDVTGREAREADDDIHVKEVMVDRDFEEE